MKSWIHKAIGLSMSAILCLNIASVINTPVFAITEEEMVEQQLDMPIVSITSSSTISTKNSYVDATVVIYDETGAINVPASPISIRLRGNSTLNADKKSYRLKFAAKQNPLSIGDAAGKPWNLVSSCYDTSLLRHMTAYEMGDMLDNIPYTPNAKNVEVYLNGSYQGVYLLTEAVNVNKSRVNIAENVDEVENTGYLLEMTRYAEENYFEVGMQRYEIKSDLSADTVIADQQAEYINSYISDCYMAIQDGDQEMIDSLIDIDSLVDIYIGSEIVKNVDAGWDSFYLYKDVNGKLTFGPMWDFDLALGNFIDVKGFDSWKGLNVYDVANINSNSNPWFCYVIQQSWFRELIVARWKEKLSELQTLDEFVEREAEINQNSYAHNFTKWNVLGTKVFSEPDEIAALTTHTAHAQYLADWIENRVNWLDSYFNSADFKNGVFLDENGKEISEDINIAEYATKFMMFASNYEITDTPSCKVNFAQNSWWNMYQLCMTGIMMEEGEEYLVSFDCSASSNMDVKWKIQQNYGAYTSYHSGLAIAASEVEHYETTFKATESDFNCAFVIEGNGTGGSSVTIDNIVLKKLTKYEPQILPGDVNGDGRFNVSDVVLLQKWLLAVPDTILSDWEAADLCEDDKLDVFDLCMMKRLLLEQ